MKPSDNQSITPSMTFPAHIQAELKAFVPVRYPGLEISRVTPHNYWVVYVDGGLLQLQRVQQEPGQSQELKPMFAWRLFDKDGASVATWSTGERVYTLDGKEVPVDLPVMSERMLRVFCMYGDMVPPQEGFVSTYSYNRKLFQRDIETWNQAAQCAASFNALRPEGARDEEGLNGLALEVFQYLSDSKGPGAVGMVPSLEPVISELCRRGLVTVTEPGYARPLFVHRAKG